MTLKKAYINITITLLLLVTSIILFVLKVSSNYVFWYHVVFYIASTMALCVAILSIVFITKHLAYKYHKILEAFDWMLFTLQSLTVILLMFMFFLFSSTVKQSSMAPTLQEGQIVIASQFNYVPQRGDIIIIHVDPEKHPGEDDKLLVKRIAAIPGDLVELVESPADGGYKIFINGSVYRPLDDDYIARYAANERAVIVSSLDDQGYVKDGEYLVFGDNEANSKDSRNLGTFELEDIIGHVIFRMWPFGGLS